MEFATLATLVGSGGIEIAQTHRAQAVGATVGCERVFEKKLGGAIGIDRLARRLLGDRNLRERVLLWDAIDGAAGGKDETADPGVQRGVQQAKGGENVVVEILARVFYRLSHVGVGGKVHHRVDARERRPEARLVGDVALEQFEALRQAAAAGGEIVVEQDVVAGTP